MSDLTTPGRRSAGSGDGRLGLPAVLAVVLPLLTVVALLAVRAHDAEAPAAAAPTETRLGRADVGCPAGAGDVLVASTGEDTGAVSVGEGGGEPRDVDLSVGRPAVVTEAKEVQIAGTGAMAPGLLAVRAASAPVTALACPQPRSESWFTGLGASSTRSSTLTLLNPDPGPAVVDIELLTENGVLEVPGVRGVAVPGRGSVTLDLSKRAPSRLTLAAHVSVVRGRAAVSVSETADPVGGAKAVSEWVPAQAEPAETLLLAGLPRGAEAQSLVLANPGTDEARVEVQLVGRSTLTPTRATVIRVPGGGITTAALPWLRQELRRDPDTVAVQLNSTQPVTATLQSRVAGDAVITTASPTIAALGATALPTGVKASLVLAGAETSGAATITVTNARGRQILSEDVRLQPGSGSRMALPTGAALVRVATRRTPISAVVELSGPRGAAVLPLVEPPTTGRVPAVRPALP